MALSALVLMPRARQVPPWPSFPLILMPSGCLACPRSLLLFFYPFSNTKKTPSGCQSEEYWNRHLFVVGVDGKPVVVSRINDIGLCRVTHKLKPTFIRTTSAQSRTIPCSSPLLPLSCGSVRNSIFRLYSRSRYD